MIYILMYSGGVDSILCLKMLRDQGITPFLFHIKTQKLKRRHERMIRKTARLLSPESPFYVWETKTRNYTASWGKNGEYHVFLTKNNVTLMPQNMADIIVMGYTGWDSNDGRRKLRNQTMLLKQSRERGFPFMFPLADMRKTQVNQLFNQLPIEIRMNTVSSTRFFKGEWGETVYE